VLWSAGQSPASRADPRSLSLPFPTNTRGAMQTDAALRVLRHQRVFALGDVAVRWGGPVGGRPCQVSWHPLRVARLLFDWTHRRASKHHLPIEAVYKF
jgi:NADH dehydrogenase FAD-containing subunit